MNKNATYLPTILLYGEVINSERLTLYPDKEFETDNYWAGGSFPKYYRWEKTINITRQAHSSNTTRASSIYNGLDIFSGMWVSDILGNSLKIINVSFKSPTSVIVTLEDVDRVNTFKDSSSNGDGDIKSDRVVIFELDDESLPIVPRVPSEINAPNLPSFISSRFQTWNPNRRYKINKLAHGFNVNDVIVVNQSTHNFEKANETNIDSPVIGTVLEVYPNKFFISPINRVVTDIEPSLPGNVGDYVYLDYDTNGYTNIPSEKRLFVKLTDSVMSHVTGTVDSPSITAGTAFKVNSVEYIIPSTNIEDLVSLVNVDTNIHNVTMSTLAGATVSQTNPLQLYYGVIGIILPATASINGHSITFNSDTYGSGIFGPGMANHTDIVNDINDANIPNITASYENGNIIIKNTVGGDVIIQNITSDSSGTPFAGNTSCTGLPFETYASGSSFKVYMERVDGGAITLENTYGTPIDEMGLFSVQNGRLPEGMIIENWNRVGETYVVDNMIARDNIYPIFTGDTVLVLDQGNGEWIKYMYVNGEFIVTATQDSARTDAMTLETLITFDSPSSTLIGTVSEGSRITLVTVEVITPFDGINVSMNIGDSDNNDALLGDDYIDLGVQSIYQNNTAVIYNQGGDTDLYVYFDKSDGVTGEAKILISYM